MKELIAFILPPAVALVGIRLCRWITGEKFQSQFSFGFRAALGLAVGMFVFAQAVLLGALAGINAAGVLAWSALLWGGLELVLLVMKLPAGLKLLQIKAGHMWLLLVIPLAYAGWVFGRLSTLEGTLEFDANAFWVFKAKIIYLEQGKDLVNVLRQPDLSYTHMDYPWLVPGIYALDYGAVGGVDEFVNKVWPFWMMVALCAGILSIGFFWKYPGPLPIAVATLIAFLPATLEFTRNEGGTIPMVFYASLLALLLVNINSQRISGAMAVAFPVMAGCAMIKFEGMIFGALCFCVLFPIFWKCGWLKDRSIWKSVLATCACLLPYAWYRLTKPVPYIEADWWRAIFAAPGSVLVCYPRALFLSVFGPFFSSDFFHWVLKDNIHVQCVGKWTGLNSLVNDQMAVLPWLLLVLLAITFWKKRQWAAVLSLTISVLGVFAFLPFVISCISHIRSETPQVPDFTFGIGFCNNITMGRYMYPFFIAWFLGTAAVWFAAGDTAAQQRGPTVGQFEKKPPPPQPQTTKRKG